LEFRRFLRRYQMRVLLVGKRRAIDELTQAPSAGSQPAAESRRGS
jgi:hypothetical protein